MTHTPGPWAVHDDEGTYSILAEREPTDYEQLNPPFDRKRPVHVAEVWAEAERSLLDARLIAAAPDLLAALEALEGWTRDLRFGYGLTGPEVPLDRARAAIAKAKGGEE